MTVSGVLAVSGRDVLGISVLLLLLLATVWAIRSKGGLRRGIEESLTDPGSTLFDTGPYQFVCALVCLPFLAIAELLKKPRTPEQEAAVERSLRLMLGERYAVGEHEFSGQREYYGERGGVRVVVPDDLERIEFEVNTVGLYLHLRGLHKYTNVEDVRFSRDGALRKGNQAVDALPAEAQAAVRTLGQLGCREICFAQRLQLQMPYRQTPEQFADVVGEFARAGDVLAAAMADLVPDQFRTATGRTASTGSGASAPGSVGPPR